MYCVFVDVSVIVYYALMDDDAYDSLMYWLLIVNQWYNPHKVKIIHIGIESNKSAINDSPPRSVFQQKLHRIFRSLRLGTILVL